MPNRRTTYTQAEIDKMRVIDAYEHSDQERMNNPPVGMAQFDKQAETSRRYEFDPHLDPTLQWAGKAEGMSFDVPTSSIHIHESIKPHKIINSVVKRYSDALKDQEVGQTMMFEAETPADRFRRRREAIEFYKHGVDWTNRLIAGDSLVIMNSMLEKEGMAGQVQMVYIDPPYGIKYGSNFQPFVDNRDVKDKKDDDLDQTPEMITAFRDTWELGIHSYLTYLRNRLLLARELLSESGSAFVQISDENLHHIRELCDEVFGSANFVCLIPFAKTASIKATLMASTYDYLVWYCKDKERIKYRRLFVPRQERTDGGTYNCIELADGSWRRLTKPELLGEVQIPSDSKLFRAADISRQGASSSEQPFEFQGKTYYPSPGRHWAASCPEGMNRLVLNNRIVALPSVLSFKAYADDFPFMMLSNVWNDTIIGTFTQKDYVVQTAALPIQRCMLMTTDPGDLVLDITCGSGTTAYVAEQWGRRWVTCDTSRVAITLAKQRLMTATFDYYKLAQEDQGVGSGFVYKTIPHITLKSIANNETPVTETLYDQPEIDKTKVRISGPFTVEALPAPVVKPLDDLTEFVNEDPSAKHTDWRDELKASGIIGRGGARISFSRVEPLSGTKYLQAEAETREDIPRKAVICFAGETKPLDPRMVSMALDEAETLRPAPQMIVFAAFQFDPEAAKDIDEMNWPGVTILKAQMNTDLMTDDLKKKRSSSQSFWLIGQPDVELIKDGRSKSRYKVRVNGFDYYDVKKGTVDSGNDNRIAMWMLDTDYDGMSIEPHQVFFPMGGQKDGWNKLARTLKAEIDPDLIEKFAGNESLWFDVQSNSRIAVKIIDDRGIESLKVIKVGEV